MQKNPNAAFLVLRLGLAFVFLWFSFSQFHNPMQWTGFLPHIVKALPMPGVTFVRINALFELCSAVLLVFGIWTRPVALLLGLHLLGIAATLGMNAVGVRDIGLAVASLTLAIGGAGMYSLDSKASATMQA